MDSEYQDPVSTPMKVREPSTPSTTGSRRSSTQLQPLRPTRLFQLGAPSTSNSASASTQSSRHASINPSPGSFQVVQPSGNHSLPDLREMEQHAERSDSHTPVATIESSSNMLAQSARDVMMPATAHVDRTVQSFHDLRLTNDWEGFSLMPASLARHEAEQLSQNSDTPKALSTTSLLRSSSSGRRNHARAAATEGSNNTHNRPLDAGTDNHQSRPIESALLHHVHPASSDPAAGPQDLYTANSEKSMQKGFSRRLQGGAHGPYVENDSFLTSSQTLPSPPESAYAGSKISLGQPHRQSSGSHNANRLERDQRPHVDSRQWKMPSLSRGPGGNENSEPQHLSPSHIGAHWNYPMCLSTLIPTSSRPEPTFSAASLGTATVETGHGPGPSTWEGHRNRLAVQIGEPTRQFGEDGIFDHRWLAQSTEVWKSEPRRQSSNSDMSPRHGRRVGSVESTNSTGRSRNGSAISNPYATFDHYTTDDTRVLETDAASVTNSTISTRVSSIFDRAPSTRQPHQHLQHGDSQQASIRNNANRREGQHPTNIELPELQGSAFHHQLGQFQAGDTSQLIHRNPFLHQSQAMQAGNFGSPGTSLYINHPQQIRPEHLASYHGAPYPALSNSSLPAYSPSVYGVSGPQGRPNPVDPQYGRPTLPPSGRRQATMAKYERMKAEQLAAQNAALTLQNMQMQHAVGESYLPGPAPSHVASDYHGAYPHAGGLQIGQSVHLPRAATLFAPAPIFADRSQHSDRFNSDLSSAANFLPNAYRPGSDLMNPRANGISSDRFQQLLRSGAPSLAQTFSNDNMPFTTTSATNQGNSFGIVRLGNIPYTLTVPAVYALLGSSAGTLPPDLGPAIHIMMDRSSGKTGNECFVEFLSVADAERLVRKMRSTSSAIPFSNPATPMSDISSQGRSPYRHRHNHSSGSYSGSRFATPTPSQHAGRQIEYDQQVLDSGYGSPQSFASLQESRGTEYRGSSGVHKLGDRTIYIEMSTQDAFLSMLFPKAKNVSWVDGEPVIKATNEAYNSGFKTFVSKEELVLLVKYAEAPQKSQYTSRSPQRPYQSMISTLAKFPWASQHLITIQSRNDLYEATRTLIRTLLNYLKHHSPEHAHPLFYYAAHPTSFPSSSSRVRSSTVSSRGSNSNRPTNHITSPDLNPQLLADLVSAGINASGFSESQRWDLVMASELMAKNPGIDDFVIKTIQSRMSPLAMYWPFEVLQRKRGVNDDVVELYANILAASRRSDATASIDGGNDNPFGAYVGPLGGGDLSMTLLDAGAVEWDSLLGSLALVLR